MKYLVGIGILFTSITSYALPILPGNNFRVQIPNEYIVKTNGEKAMFSFKKKLANNLYLVEGNQKAFSGYKVYPNYEYFGEFKESAVSVNDEKFGKQYHHVMINSLKAWETTFGEKEIIVAVTDNEFQLDHEDLETSWWKNPNEIADNGIDDDGNGYIDDVYGWDFIEGDNNVDSKDETTHGTHVAGIIAATANNSVGGTGIAPGVRVMPLRWYSSKKSWTSAIVAETYHYAVDHGAKIISTSYNIDGLVDDELYIEAVKYARDHDVLIFNSAGNLGAKNPTRQKMEDVILVCSVKSASSSNQDVRSRFSNYGTGIDICAPGDPILAPVQNNGWFGAQNRYGELQGTSMATPVAAAVAALIWSAHPNYSDEEVRQKLYDSADSITAKNPTISDLLGAGRVNAAKAVK